MFSSMPIDSNVRLVPSWLPVKWERPWQSYLCQRTFTGVFVSAISSCRSQWSCRLSRMTSLGKEISCHLRRLFVLSVDLLIEHIVRLIWSTWFSLLLEQRGFIVRSSDEIVQGFSRNSPGKDYLVICLVIVDVVVGKNLLNLTLIN